MAVTVPNEGFKAELRGGSEADHLLGSR